MNKPFEIRYVEAKDLIVNAINSARTDYGVSYIFIDTIIQDLARQVSQNAKNELKQCNENYKMAIKQVENSNKDKDKEENNQKDEKEKF